MSFTPFHSTTGVLEFATYEPNETPKAAVVLVHGRGVRPDGWIHTIDGEPGWAPRLAEAGYRAVVPTWPGLSAGGRWDGASNRSGGDVAQGLIEFIERLDQPVVLMVHSMAGAFGYRIAFDRPDLLLGLVALAPAPPGDIQPVPDVIGEDENRVTVQGHPLVWELPKSGWWTPGLDFVETKLVGASERFPPERIPDLREQLVSIPARLLLERQNVNGAQVRFGDRRLPGTPVLLLVGSHDTDHPVDADRAVARWLEDRGAQVEFRPLVDGPLRGNGHMLMLESNSDAVLTVILRWLADTILPARLDVG
nr:alpha/beta fold hydrolase [Microbacterium bovistercoris]